MLWTLDHLLLIATSLYKMGLERNRRRNSAGLDAVEVFPYPTGGATICPGGGTAGNCIVRYGLRFDDGTITIDRLQGNSYIPPKTYAAQYRSDDPALVKINRDQPLKSKYFSPWGGAMGIYAYFYLLDDFETTLQQMVNDDQNRAAGLGFIPLITADGIVPYTGMREEADQLKESLGFLQTAEQAQVDQLLRTHTPQEAALISQQTVTNPLGSALVNRLVGQVVSNVAGTVRPSATDPTSQLMAEIGIDLNKTVVLPTDPNVRGQLNLPTGPDNTLTQAQEAQRQLDLAGQQTALATYSYGPNDAEAAAVQQASDLNYWKANYPTVTIRPEDNLQIPKQILYTSWSGPNPPLANVQVTPRQISLPTLGWIGKNPWIAAVGAIIPIVGPVVSVGLSFESSREKQDYTSSFQVQPDQFKPQYYPKPFNVVLPLDRAQLAVNQPWFVQAMVAQFLKELQRAQLAMAQGLVNSTVPGGTGAPVVSGATPNKPQKPVTILNPNPAKPKPLPLATAGIASRFFAFGVTWP